jgi:hypothetical protein
VAPGVDDAVAGGGTGASGRVGPAFGGADAGVEGGATSGVLEQATSTAASVPRMAFARRLAPEKAIVMWVILLEALGALALLVLIVWWTMFSGRRRGERRDD